MDSEDFHLALVDKKNAEIYAGKNVGRSYFFSPKGNAKFGCDCNVKVQVVDEEMVRTDSMRIEACHEKSRSLAMKVARATTSTAEQNQDAADRAARDAAIPVMAWGVAAVVMLILSITFIVIYTAA
jgi:hypothetical protein